jgi:hypothetical protein
MKIKMYVQIEESNGSTVISHLRFGHEMYIIHQIKKSYIYRSGYMNLNLKRLERI